LKSPKTKYSSSKSRDIEKEGENSTSKDSDGNANNFGYENPESSSKEPENSEVEDSHAKRMSELKKCLEAITNQNELREMGVVRPYPIEWVTSPYPPRFKAPTLHSFDGEGSPNQHI